MYNKLFTAILDSSIWLEPDATRIVWVTLIAAMDETGFARFAAVENLAGRARVSVRAAAKAVETLESPDLHNPGQDDEGRRIERVPGGWIVRNALKYRSLVTKALQREATRKRVRRHRERNRRLTDRPLQHPGLIDEISLNGSHVTQSVTRVKRQVTQSEAEAEAYTEAEKNVRTAHPRGFADGFGVFWAPYPKKVGKQAAIKAWVKLKPTDELLARILAAIDEQARSDDWTREGGRFIPHPASWLNGKRWQDEVGVSVVTDGNGARLSAVSARINQTLTAAASIMAEPDVPGTES